MLHTIDGELRPWDDVKSTEKWTGILLGNGSSRAVWDDFKYSSLYDMAAVGPIVDRLSPHDIKLFSTLHTKDFERVLNELLGASRICDALGIDGRIIDWCYESIQKALIQVCSLIWCGPA